MQAQCQSRERGSSEKRSLGVYVRREVPAWRAVRKAKLKRCQVKKKHGVEGTRKPQTETSHVGSHHWGPKTELCHRKEMTNSAWVYIISVLVILLGEGSKCFGGEWGVGQKEDTRAQELKLWGKVINKSLLAGIKSEQMIRSGELDTLAASKGVALDQGGEKLRLLSQILSWQRLKNVEKAALHIRRWLNRTHQVRGTWTWFL